ncbi:MAG: S9 family peptidase [Candidatus Eremiobacteraeota bacterium]|nr:S9 family peptidase [Candidatus Eremiobacteraeota bacterium]
MNDAKHNAQELYVIDPTTGAQTELTRGVTSVQQIAWNPTGDHIAFTRKDPAPSKHGAAQFEDAFRVDDNAYLDTEEARPYHIWLVDLSGHEQRITSGPESAMNSALSWSSDGRSIVFERGPAVHGLHPLATTWRVDIQSRQTAKLTLHKRDEDGAIASPDGRTVAYIHPRGSDPVAQDEAWVISQSGSGDRDVSIALDRWVSTVAWMPDGRELLAQIDDATRSPLVLLSAHGGVRRLSMGAVMSAAILPAGAVAHDGTIAFIGDEKGHPDELYILAPHASAPSRLTHFNDAIAGLRLGNPTRVSWHFDGFAEDGVLTFPPNYIAGRRYPLVLRIHGGPNESSTLAFSTFYQLAASHGYLVFAPNYRGSTDLGNAYVRAIYNDPSAGPGRDVMAGISAVERLGIVDQSRIAVSGWSDGGMLTSWLEGHYHIWRAAVAGAAVNDFVVDYAIADDIDADRLMYTQDSPFRGNALALWQQSSPLTYYHNIRTPTLILCNVYDVRVPIVESYEMYRALHDNGVPVEFYAYPSTGHLPNGPVREADAYRRWLDWFDRYLHP